MKRKSKNEELKSKLAASLDSSARPRTRSPRRSAKKKPSSKIIVQETMSESTDSVTLSPSASSAQSVVNTSVMLAAGAGAIPVAGWDIAAIAGVQLKMLADISKIYGKPFTENVGKSTLTALIGTLAPGILAKSSFKTLPGVGQFFGMISVPLYSGAITYAVGRVFIAHYESDGTLLTFSPKDFSSRLAQEVQSGLKKVVSVKV
jgi:uncharacterized protein (DUF697 family)